MALWLGRGDTQGSGGAGDCECQLLPTTLGCYCAEMHMPNCPASYFQRISEMQTLPKIFQFLKSLHLVL